MSERWYKEAVIYSVEVDRFQDSNGDGYGDLPGLISRLDYLARLGVTCLWLSPIHPSPGRDNGYDVSNYYGVDENIGSLGDFAELVLRAEQRGIRILLDLVVNHTSDEHPWFVDARRGPESPFFDWYVWSEDEPPDRRQGIVFPGEQKETWSFDEQAKRWYYHRFYDFQPDLNWSNPAVRAEIGKVMGFWLQLGVAGFRIDAAPFVLEQVAAGVPNPPMDFSILDQWRQESQWRRRDAVLLCEANVLPPQLADYVAAPPHDVNNRAHMLFAFDVNARAWLALARGDAEPLVEVLGSLPQLPENAQWATFLRNHDELDLSRLTDEQKQDTFKAFAPQESMQLYGRGIRRRLAPMMKGDQRRIRLAYALQFSLPGTPVLRYGEEIGMGEDLSLPGRESIRTPMQWDATRGAGFSSAPAEFLPPIPSRGKFSYRQVNVRGQRRAEDSLLRWFEQLIRVVRECPEIGTGTASVVHGEVPRSVLAHRYDAEAGSIVLLHNLADSAVTVSLDSLGVTAGAYEVFSDRAYPPLGRRLTDLPLAGWGFRWIRLDRAM